MRFRQARARIAAAGLAVLAIWEVAVLVHASDHAPSAADWQAVSAHIPPGPRDDRLIVFAPQWLDPLGRHWLGDRISVAQASRMDHERFGEIWEISIRDAAAPELAGEPAVSEQTFGSLRVRRYVRNAAAVSWDLRAQSHVCEVDFAPRLGIVLDLRHPFAQVRRAFPGVTLGTELQIYAGLAGYDARSVNRSTALIQAMVDGREVTRGIVGNETGWSALPAAHTTPGIHDLEIVTRVADSAEPVMLPVCVAAEARSRTP